MSFNKSFLNNDSIKAFVIANRKILLTKKLPYNTSIEAFFIVLQNIEVDY